jgi:ADP-ribose pyrophosphatase YjhB (NUDIX family)
MGENREMPPPTQVLGMGAGAIIFDEFGHVLLVRQNYGDHRYTLPGGEVEAGEAPHAAVVREVAEETGLVATASYLVSVYWLTRPDLACPYALFGFRCEVADGSVPRVPNPDEVAEVGWFNPLSLPEPFTDGTPFLIADAVAGLRGAVWTASI